MASLENHIDAIQRYVKHGMEPGSCTRAILENDLAAAVVHADPGSQRILDEIVKYVCNNVPLEAWGSPQKVADWMTKCRRRFEEAHNG